MQMYKNPAGDKIGFLGWHGGSDNDRDVTSHLLDGNFFDWRWDEMKGRPQEGKQIFPPVGLWNPGRARQGGMEGETEEGTFHMIP